MLIIGGGPSGIDITFDLSNTAKYIGISHHSTYITSDTFPVNVAQLPDVSFITGDGNVHFINETTKAFDAIIFCTGYKYNFPFLTDECGIKTTNNHVTSLYKHVVNIEHPTMFFIGLTNVTIFTYLIEFQVFLKCLSIKREKYVFHFNLKVQFSVKILMKQIELPTKNEMYEELEADIEDRHLKGYKGKKMHQLWPDYMRRYLDGLVKFAHLTPIKPVLLEIYDESRALSYNDIKNYRKYKYQIIDDQRYLRY